MTDDVSERYRVAVLLPCYNEAATIGAVVRGFRTVLPAARIYVYDNNSVDGTALAALLAGAEVRQERRQGKGHVVRRMFADIDADLYLLADGDLTYDPADAPALIATLFAESADMVTGCRAGLEESAGRPLHATGNRAFSWLFSQLSGTATADLLSGYRLVTRRFAKSFPAEADGFAIETELAIHAVRLKAPVAECPVAYRLRPAGSSSKLRTLPDGARILACLLGLAATRHTGRIALFAALAAGLVTALAPLPMAGLAAMLLVLGGLLLDAVEKARNERLRLAYLAVPPPAGEKTIRNATHRLSADAA